MDEPATPAADLPSIEGPLSELGLCTVCGEPLPERHHASCDRCNRLFHLRMTETEQARDCGRVFVDDEHCTLALLCDPCFEGHMAGGPGNSL